MNSNGLGSSNQIQQNLPPPPPSLHQAYMYPPPPPPSSSTQPITMSQQFHFHHSHVSMLPPPPPLPPATLPPFHSSASRSSEPLALPLPPPPLARSSLPLVADTPPEKQEPLVVVDNENGSSKESSFIRCDVSSLPFEKAEQHGSPLCTDPDIEMEDDITLPENENYPSQSLIVGSDLIHGAYLNTEQPCAQVHQDADDGSRQASSSPYSGRAKIVLKSGLEEMYDPFVDSFEPASAKLDCVQEHEPMNDSYTVPKASVSSNRPLATEENNQGVDKQTLSESDMTARVSVSSNKPPDVEENTIGAVASGDNDEFGENAEGNNSYETGTPNENPKASNSVDEVDSTRKKSRGEKDSSRSTKLFKVVLTKFVKDLLKPSWRQGNMSKEAFKTIVKRVVEKVSNSMEGRRIPKSKHKIDKYIDTSRHKLTKLVMGYVDKYVKA